MSKNLMLAVVAGSLAPAIAFFAAEAVREYLGLSSVNYGFAPLVGISGIVALVALGVMLVYGLPLYLVARRFRVVGLTTVVVASLVPALAFAIVEGVITNLVATLAWIGLTLTSGFAFWGFVRGEVSHEARA